MAKDIYIYTLYICIIYIIYILIYLFIYLFIIYVIICITHAFRIYIYTHVYNIGMTRTDVAVFAKSPRVS